jgi:hypothetical protein
MIRARYACPNAHIIGIDVPSGEVPPHMLCPQCGETVPLHNLTNEKTNQTIYFDGNGTIRIEDRRIGGVLEREWVIPTLTPDELRQHDTPDSAAAQWLADYEYAIETDPHTTANDIGALAERAVAVIRAQQAELAALKATPTLENGEERIWIDGVPHIVVNGEWVRDEEMWNEMNGKPN